MFYFKLDLKAAVQKIGWQALISNNTKPPVEYPSRSIQPNMNEKQTTVKPAIATDKIIVAFEKRTV
jgi:hypothetical protein